MDYKVTTDERTEIEAALTKAINSGVERLNEGIGHYMQELAIIVACVVKDEEETGQRLVLNAYGETVKEVALSASVYFKLLSDAKKRLSEKKNNGQVIFKGNQYRFEERGWDEITSTETKWQPKMWKDLGDKKEYDRNPFAMEYRR